jgi:hypothetical protein
VPTDAHPEPEVFRMKLWALDDVKARSKFWYFMSRLKKVKKANGQIIACNEVRLCGWVKALERDADANATLSDANRVKRASRR